MKNPLKALIAKIRSRIRQKYFVKFKMEPVGDMTIMGYKLVRTCYACPEQYDVFNKKNSLVGYLRLRPGVFTVQYPDVYAPVIFEAYPVGDGLFEHYERDHFLTKAVLSIKREEVVSRTF
jgi:hypothetical protein